MTRISRYTIERGLILCPRNNLQCLYFARDCNARVGVRWDVSGRRLVRLASKHQRPPGQIRRVSKFKPIGLAWILGEGEK